MTKDFRGFLLNCFIGGDTNTQLPDGGWIRNRLRLSFAGYDVEIIQAPEFISANPVDYCGNSVETTEVIFRSVDAAHREDVIEKLHGLATFSRSSPVLKLFCTNGSTPFPNHRLGNGAW